MHLLYGILCCVHSHTLHFSEIMRNYTQATDRSLTKGRDIRSGFVLSTIHCILLQPAQNTCTSQHCHLVIIIVNIHVKRMAKSLEGNIREYTEGVRIYASVKKPTIIETIRLNRLRWIGCVQRMEENRIPKMVLYMNLGTTRLRGRPRNRWQDEVREDGRIVGGEGRQEKVHNREEWKKLQRTARNRYILHMPME